MVKSTPAPQNKSTRVSAKVRHGIIKKRRRDMPGILYALKSQDKVTGKPMSCKIGRTTRTLAERQQELSQSREDFSVKIGVENVNIPGKREALVKLMLKEICPGRWYYSDTKLEFLHHRASPLLRNIFGWVTTLENTEVIRELQIIKKRVQRWKRLCAKIGEDDSLRAVDIRNHKGNKVVPDSEAIWDTTSDEILHNGARLSRVAYVQQFKPHVAHPNTRRDIWSFPTRTMPLKNLNGERFEIA